MDKNTVDLSVVPLNRPGDEVTIKRAYSSHGEQYSVTILVDGVETTGWGPSPKDAYADAALDWEDEHG